MEEQENELTSLSHPTPYARPHFLFTTHAKPLDGAPQTLLSKSRLSIRCWNQKTMWGVRKIVFEAASRRDLCYVSENEGFLFWTKTMILDLSGDRNNKYIRAI